MISILSLLFLLCANENNLCKLQVNNEKNKNKTFFNFHLTSDLLKNNFKKEVTKFDKFPVDCIFSIGTHCRPAHYLEKYKLRFQASPFDWMMKYSLDEVINQLKNKFVHFFEDIEDITPENSKSAHRTVRDKIGKTVSIHHFPMDISAEDYLKTFRETMIRRGEKIDQIIRNSQHIGFVYENNFDNSDKIIEFGKEIDELYPNKQVVIFNIINLKEKIPTCLYSVNHVSENLIEVKIQFRDVPVDKDGNEYDSWRGNESKWVKYVLDHIIASNKLNQRLLESVKTHSD